MTPNQSSAWLLEAFCNTITRTRFRATWLASATPSSQLTSNAYQWQIRPLQALT